MGKRLTDLALYRVYGFENGNGVDIYVEAYTAQDAADKARAGRDESYHVEEVARVIYNWR